MLKRWKLLSSVCSLVLVLGVSGSTSEVCASGSCSNRNCTRSLQCLVECPDCTGDFHDPGVCWYDE